MLGTIVGVLRGGPSSEHDVSLKTGASILANLDSARYTTRDIFIDRSGVWHLRGIPVSPEDALRSIDAAIVGLHGEYGEDGEVQKILERNGVPYTGSEPFPSFVAMHKVMAKERARAHGVLTPEYRFIERAEDIDTALHDVIRSFSQPVVVKPVRWGSSVGISVVGGYAPLHDAVSELFERGSPGVLIEERIIGREATSAVIENLRGEKLYRLPPIEIIPPQNDFFSYDAKYSGATRELCPSTFPKEVKQELERISALMHEALGLRHYSRSDFIVSPKGLYYLETNALPALTSESLLPKSLAAVGIPVSDFVHHLVGLALTS